jgi:hypothetical protein
MSHAPPRSDHRSRLPLLVIIAALTLTATACSGKNGSDTDTSTDGSTDVLEESDGSGPAPPALPEAPAPPALTPCPDGWREVEDPDNGAVTCNPWPEGGAHECADDEAHFPGEPGCTTIGTPCGSGDWATDLPTDRTIIYVRAGEPSGGDGSETSPYATIAEAMGDAGPGDVVTLSKGTFDEIVTIAGGVTLWGACTAETLVTCSIPGDSSGTIVPVRSDSEVRNLTISGERPGVYVGVPGRTMALVGVVILGARTNGILTYGDVTLQEVAIRGTRSGHTLTDQGTGIEVDGGGQAEMSRVVLEDNRTAGVIAWTEGTAITASDVVIRGTLPSGESNDFGYGLLVQDGSSVHVERAWIEANHCGGIHVNLGASLQASDIIVRDTLACAIDSDLGRGIMVENGSSLELSRAHIASNMDIGVTFLAGSHGDLSDVVVTETRRNEYADELGLGIQVQQASDIRVTRALLDGNHYAGIYASMTGTTLDLVDVSVYGTQVGENDSQPNAEGIGVVDGVTATLTRVHLEGNIITGMRVKGEGASATISDLTVVDTVGFASHNSGFGFWILAGAEATIDRALIDGNRDVGVSVEGAGTLLSMTDVTIENTRSQDVTGWWGRGLQAMQGSHTDLTRVVLAHNQELGLSALHPGTEVIGTDVVIRDTIERECASSTCEGRGHGCGLSAQGEARVDLTSFIISGNILCGIQICYGVDLELVPYTIGGQVDLHQGSVSDNPIGVNVQTSDYDLDRLMDYVLYFDNDTNLDSYDLPVPDMATSGL